MLKTQIDSNGKIHTINFTKEKIQNDVSEIDSLINDAISNLPMKQIIAMIDKRLLNNDDLCDMFRANLEWQIAIHK